MNQSLLDFVRRGIPKRSAVSLNMVTGNVFKLTKQFTVDDIWKALQFLVESGEVEQVERGKESFHQVCLYLNGKISKYELHALLQGPDGHGQRLMYSLTKEGKKLRPGRPLTDEDVEARRKKFVYAKGAVECPNCSSTDTATNTEETTFPVAGFFCFACRRRFRGSTITAGIKVKGDSKMSTTTKAKTKSKAKATTKAKSKSKAKATTKAKSKAKAKAKAKAKPKPQPKDKKPSKMAILRSLFANKKVGEGVKLETMLEKTGWNAHVLHSAMAVARDETRTKNPNNVIKAEYDRSKGMYIAK